METITSTRPSSLILGKVRRLQPCFSGMVVLAAGGLSV